MTELTAEQKAADAALQEVAPDAPAEPGIGQDQSTERALPPPVAAHEPPAPRPEPIRMSPGDAKRAEYAKRLAEERAEHEQAVQPPFDGDWTNDQNRYGVHGKRTLLEPVPGAPEPGVPAHEVAVQPPAEPISDQAREAPPPAAPPLQQQPYQPRLYPVRVNHQTFYVTEEQLVAEAQKSIAAGNILESAKEMSRGARPNQGQQPANNGYQSDQAREQQQPHQGDPLLQIAEELQYGDPAKAAQGLREVMDAEAARKARDELKKQRMRDHLARGQQALNELIAANQDLLSDPDAEDLLTRRMRDYYRQDLAAIGVSRATHPDFPDGDAVKLANWHREAAVDGLRMRDPKDLLTIALADYRAKYGQQKPPNQPATRQAPASNVQVNLNRDVRDARRAAIPTQPTRTVASRPAQAAAATVEQSREAAIQDMRRARGRIVAA